MRGYGKGGNGGQAPGEVQGGTNPPEKPTGAQTQPWYQTAQEAAQILVSALALYASLKKFLEKMSKRRGNKRQEEV